jgi:hypothetical protein
MISVILSAVWANGLGQPDPILARCAAVDREWEPPHVEPQRLADHVQRGERADDLPRHHWPLVCIT